jgi:hypothetical protein
MNKKRFLLATDYKSNFFSAVFSFESEEEAFKKMNKPDLLHCYMVGQIILSFEDLDSEDDSYNQFSSTIATQDESLGDYIDKVKSTIRSMRRQVGPKFSKKLNEGIDHIKKSFPIETTWIDSLIEDDSSFLRTSFFAPQILQELLGSFELYEARKHPQLITVNLGELSEVITNFESAVLCDTINALNNRGYTDKDNEAIRKNAPNYIKQIVQQHFLANGEFARFVESVSKVNEPEIKPE